MDWHKLTAKLLPVAGENISDEIDIVSSLMSDFGAEGEEIDDPYLVNEYILSGAWDATDLTLAPAGAPVLVSAYYKDDGILKSVAAGVREIAEKSEKISGSEISWVKVQDEDWKDNWKKYFHTERIGEKIVVKPSWEEYERKPGDVVIIIDPGEAFGTGTHPTTSMCLRALEKYMTERADVIDVGTGSGILAIAAAKLGAAHVLAIDIDDSAVKIAAENVGMNGLDTKIELRCGNLLSGVKEKAGIIISNAIADVIIRLLPDAAGHLAKNGIFIASGIIADRADEVRAAAAASGLSIIYESAEKEWRAMAMRREIEK